MSKFDNTPGNNVYDHCWRHSLKARAKAGKADSEVTRDSKANLKSVLTKYVDDFVKQAAIISVDWWDKLKSLEINIKEEQVPQ